MKQNSERILRKNQSERRKGENHHQCTQFKNVDL